MPILREQNLAVYDGRIPRLFEKDEPKMSNVSFELPTQEI